MVFEEANEQLFKKHTELCNELNLDSDALNEAWNSFQTLSQSYTLEGDQLHWLGCAVFAACRRCITPTVGSTNIEGNCVNLTSLLRYCNMNLVQFFTNIRLWSEMTNMPDRFQKKIELLEESFSVTCNIFKEYCVIFSKIFKTPDLSELNTQRQHRNRKQSVGFRSVQCSPSKIFEFIWNLYITIKIKDEAYSNDLVQSYHLLLGIFDLAFKNTIVSDRKDLLNPEFQGLPENFLSSTSKIRTEAPCIIDKIINNPNNVLEAKYVEKYQCNKVLELLFEEGILQGDPITFTGLFDNPTFETNFKEIKKAYETELLNTGGFDDRIFLAEHHRKLLEKEQESLSTNPTISAESSVEENHTDSHMFGMVTTRAFDTPLTGRKFLSPKNGQELSSVASASQNIARLHGMLTGRSAQPSEKLSAMFQSYPVNPTGNVEKIISNLGEKFITSFVTSDNPENKNDYAKNRLLIGTKLFYKLIESILEYEKTINRDLSELIHKEIFYKCVFACSMEIILYSYDSKKKFPWILDALELDSCEFLKVIELIVRSKDPFYRDTIKHLNKVEETILESLAWKSSSNLWNLIERCEDSIPKEEEVALPCPFIAKKSESVNISCSEISVKQESPGPLSATERFQSPIQNCVSRQLFPVAPLGTHQTHQNKSNETDTSVPSAKPKRTGSLAIFFRKFYNLAAVRMEHLCGHLNIVDEDLKRKIWTTFEVSIQKHAEQLLKNRHLDQLLMCAVYVIPKVLQKPQTFMEIMKCYRQQPQADSHIYRNVLLQEKTTKTVDGQEVEISERRGDLIEFYNNVYVIEMKNFSMKFANNSGTTPSDIFVSPLPIPCGKKNMVSPSVQLVENVFVKPLDSNFVQSPSAKSYSYFFSRSPSRDLRDINKAINNNVFNVNGKRLLIDGDETQNNKKIANRKVQSLLEERRSQYANRQLI